MTEAGLWGCLRDANHQTHNDPGTSFAQSLHCLQHWTDAPRCVRSFSHNGGRINPPILIEPPDLLRGEFLVVEDQHCEDATFGLLPLCSYRAWVLYEPCALSGARWMTFHQWPACLAQIRAGLHEAGSSGYLTFTVMTTGEPKFT